MKTDNTETCHIPIPHRGTVVGQVVQIERLTTSRGGVYHCARALLLDNRQVQSERQTRDAALEAVIENARETVLVGESLQLAKELGTFVHAKTVDRHIKRGGGREIAISLVQHAQDLADGAIILVEKRMTGPALALARPMVESYARAMWAKDARPHELQRFRQGKRKGWDDLIRQVEERAPEEAPWVRSIMEANREDLHDLTHGGYLHVAGRRTHSSIEPRYSPQMLQWLLATVVIEIYIRCGLALFEWMGDANACAELDAWLTEKDVNRPPIPRPHSNAT